MKVYQKKNASIEDETVLVHIERRHTLKEDTNEADSDNFRKKVIRANSLGSFEEDHSSMDVEAVSDEKESGLKRKPTVITESELSSSRLYKDRKAKINSDDEGVEDSRPTMPHKNHEDLEPRTLNDSNFKPIPVSNQRSQKSFSCCLYFTIILVICIACLAVMAGVGGIVYMEYFAVYEDKDIAIVDESVKDDTPSVSKEIFQQPNQLENFNQDEPKIPENILRQIINKATKRASTTEGSRVTVTSPPTDDIFHDKELMASNNSEAKELTDLKSSFVSENQDIEMTEHLKTIEHSDVSSNINGRFNHINVPISDKSVEIRSNAGNQDSEDLNLNIQNIDNMEKISEHTGTTNEKMMENGNTVSGKRNFKKVLDSSEEALVFGRSFNFDEMPPLQDFELNGEQVNANITFLNHPEIRLLSDGNSFDRMENSIDHNHEESSFDREMHGNDHDSKDHSFDHEINVNDHEMHGNGHDSKDNSFDQKMHGNDHEMHGNGHDIKDNSFDHEMHGSDHDSKDNSFDETEHSVGSNDMSLDDNSKNSSHFDSDDSFSEGRSLADDQNQNSDDSAQLVFLQPVVNSKAVPIPLAFLRRIGFDIKNADRHQPMTANDMDIKFSLAEALKYLKSLDSDDKLPTSREKTAPQKTSIQKESNEIGIKKESNKTKVPISSERQEYLNRLRKKMFEDKL